MVTCTADTPPAFISRKMLSDQLAYWQPSIRITERLELGDETYHHYTQPFAILLDSAA